MDAGSIIVKIKSDLSDFNDGLNKAKSHTDGFLGGLTRFGGIAAAGIGVATAAVGAFGGMAVKEFSDSQNAVVQLNTVLKSTGGVAGVTSEAALNLASSLQKVTTFSDEAILGGENLLLTFTNIGKDVFPEATETMLDMSQALGQDVKSSAIQLGKALQDPIQGVTALRRVGVNFSEAQQEMIKKMVEAGDVMGAQKFILKELKTEFGGSAQAAGQTFAGSLVRLQNAFSDAMETIGSGIATTLEPLLYWVEDFVSNGGLETWANVVSQALVKLFEYAKQAWDFLAPSFQALWEQLKILFENLKPLLPFLGAALVAAIWLAINALTWLVAVMNDYVIPAAKAVWHWFEENILPTLIKMGEFIQTYVIPAFNMFVQFLQQYLIPPLKELWEQHGPAIMEALKWLGIALLIVVGIIVGAVVVSLVVLMTIITAVVNVINWFSKAWQWSINVAAGAVAWLAQQTTNAFNWINQQIINVVNGFRNIVGQISGALSNVWNAITQPFRSAFEWVKDQVDAVVRKLKDLNPFQRHSPSLFDLISKGNEAIKASYGDMFASINQMATANPATAIAGGGNPVAGGNIDTRIFGNITIGSEVDAENFLTRLTKNQELANKGLTTNG